MTPKIILREKSAGSWLNFTEIKSVLEARTLEDVPMVLSAVENALNEGFWIAGFISYEAAPAFDSALVTRDVTGVVPLVWFAVCKEPAILAELPKSESPESFQLDVTIPFGEDTYHLKIARIKEAIAAGETYQVNFTYRLQSTYQNSPELLFNRMVTAQPQCCGAFIETDNFAICSASPELFFKLDGTAITMRPMKGTAARGLSVADDLAAEKALLKSEKDRAENVMIVDMVRNDLGRIAQTGTVKVDELFATEQHPTLWQMTSQVSAVTEASFTKILRAIFPCSSITGAPKAQTMKIIHELEDTPRGVYTGAIGYFSPQRKAHFSVAIRTAVIDTEKHELTYGTGSGIVWDSDATSEFAECKQKCAILTTKTLPEFQLLETMLFTAGSGVYLQKRHIARMVASARYFGFKLTYDKVKRALNEFQSRIPDDTCKIRLVADLQGNLTFAHFKVPASSSDSIRLTISPHRISRNNVFLYHKTTERSIYDQARANMQGDDVVLVNKQDEITETSIANILVCIDGMLYTPLVSCGLLAGTARQAMIDDGEVVERVITLSEFKKCNEIYVLNSVRGLQKAVVM